jgi:hypothetical protein
MAMSVSPGLTVCLIGAEGTMSVGLGTGEFVALGSGVAMGVGGTMSAGSVGAPVAVAAIRVALCMTMGVGTHPPKGISHRSPKTG